MNPPGERVCVRCGSVAVAEDWRCGACGHAPPIEEGIVRLVPVPADDRAGDAEYHHEALAEAEGRHFWFVARCRLIVDAIRAHFGDARTFLDLGCGRGAVARAVRQALPHMRVVAADVGLEGLRKGRRQAPAVEFVQADARCLPWCHAFDVVGAFDVIEHLDDDGAALSGVHRVLRPGGGLVLTVPQHDWLWSAADVFSGHRRRYTRARLRGLLERAGFILVRATSFMTLVLPVLALSRVRQRDPARYDPLHELRIGVVANALLNAACAGERALIRAGASLPVGGSLLVVARRAN